ARTPRSPPSRRAPGRTRRTVEERATGDELAVDERRHLGREHAPLPVSRLEPRVGEVDEDAGEAPVGEGGGEGGVYGGEGGAEVSEAGGGGALVHVVDEVAADLDADAAEVRAGGRALEEEAGVGAAELHLDLAVGPERHGRGAEREVGGVERVDVVADARHE